MAHGLAVGDHVDLVVVGNPLRWMMLRVTTGCVLIWKATVATTNKNNEGKWEGDVRERKTRRRETKGGRLRNLEGKKII